MNCARCNRWTDEHSATLEINSWPDIEDGWRLCLECVNDLIAWIGGWSIVEGKPTRRAGTL